MKKKIVSKWKVKYEYQGRFQLLERSISASSKAQATRIALKTLRSVYGNKAKIVEVYT